MPIRVVFFAFLLISACRSDRIACPEIPADKIRMTVIRPGQLKKKDQEDKVTASMKYRPSDFRPRTDLKKAASIDDWDCPRPGKIQKVAREQKRRMEKQMKLERKRRREMDSLSTVPFTLRLPDRER
jgi:hypothetical protein